jgi:hypothetical protein
MKLQNAINNIPSVASGGSASFNLPVGIRYHGFNLFLSSSGARVPVTTTNFQRLRVIVDTVTLIDWDWPSIQYYALRRGISLSTGQIPIYFTDPMLVGLRNAYAGSIDTKQGITNVQVYILLGTITAPTVVGELIFDNFPNVSNAGGKQTAFNTPIMKTAQIENIPLITGYQITDINNAYPLDTLTFYNGADVNIYYLRASLNNTVIFEGIPADLAREFLAYGVVTPIGTIVLPFTYDRFSPVSAAAFTSLSITVNSSAAFAMGIAVEVQLPSIT